MKEGKRGSGERCQLGKEGSGQARSRRAGALWIVVFALQVSSQIPGVSTPVNVGTSDFSKEKLNTAHLFTFTIISEKSKRLNARKGGRRNLRMLSKWS